MPRIAGVDLPKKKRLEIALTYIHGIGLHRSKKIIAELGLDPNLSSDKVSEAEAAKIATHIQTNFVVEGDLRREVQSNIKRLIGINCYRGQRHRLGLPTRGQRTRTNARTRKGKRKTVANKKKAVK
ncbi:MAG: 30S ribosomal protein S13 [Chlamydiae bacterium RIFCSPHIGHO2_12_FULL_49_11]|nr:MAG: 30S ribosomal protein S13 [Chlamydiae bacterium RIFCSPHIGHO2_12_FULL_49_11]